MGKKKKTMGLAYIQKLLSAPGFLHKVRLFHVVIEFLDRLETLVLKKLVLFSILSGKFEKLPFSILSRSCVAERKEVDLNIPPYVLV